MSERMTKADELNALADRCEREEPSVRLKHAIAKALGWTWVQFGYVQWRNPNGRDASVPNWCESLDAAVTLIADGVEWDATTLYGVARVAVGLNLNEGPHYASHKGGLLPMAITAAALRARASLLPAKEGE